MDLRGSAAQRRSEVVEEGTAIPPPAPSKLKAAEDFPSFFVTLMDTIQDWDRPRMNSNTKAEDFIMDSTDLEMTMCAERIVLRGRNDYAKARLKELAGDLDDRLIEWDQFIAIG
jgi:hypothetical protein